MMQEKFLPAMGVGEEESQESTPWDWQLKDKTRLASLQCRLMMIQRKRAWALSHHEVT